MAFTDTIRSLPFTPSTARARGFAPPIMRGSLHLLYLLGMTADEHVTVDAAQAEQELTHASEHFAAVTDAALARVSTASAGRVALLRTAADEARAEYGGWTQDQKLANLRDLANRAAQVCTDLDREFLGLRDSDAGSSL